MPDIKFPEVRFPEFKLPEGLRDMSREDIQKALSDMKMPDMKMPDMKMPDVKFPKRSDIAKSVEKALPTRPGPSPVLFAVLAMLGGLVVGWILATSPLTGPRISAAMDGVRHKIDDWRSGADGVDDELDTEPDAFRDAFRGPAAAKATNGGVGVGASHSAKTVAADGTSVGAESVSTERS
jgi:hypothetical protein